MHYSMHARDDEPMVNLKTKVASSLTSLLTRLAKQVTTEETKNETDDTAMESCDLETVAIGTECKHNGCEEVSTTFAYFKK